MSRIGFTGAGIDRADHLRLDAARVGALAARPDARLMRLDGMDPVVGEDMRLAWGAPAAGAELIFLGLDRETPLFAPLNRIEGPPGNPRLLWSMIDAMPAEEAALWGAARSLIGWHNRTRFCSNCGGGTETFRAGWGRKCTQCRAEHFPRVDPVVIMLAEHDGRVLLGRQAAFPPGRYSALAGFVEPGESVEEALAREVFEEAGVRVANVRYVASQPWPFPGSLMIACIAEAQSDALTLDTKELEDAIWVPREGVAAALAEEAGAPFLAPPPFAIAHSLLTRWLETH